VELIRVDDKTSDTISRRYAQCWLSRYPWPQRCVHDPGGEFTGEDFQTLLRTLLHGEPPQNIATAKEFVDDALSIAMHAMRVGIQHTTLGSSPGNLVFNRDMFLNIPLIADWHAITLRRELLINKNLIQEKQKRRQYDYLPQQCIIKKRWKPHKLDEQTSGPYRVLQTHVNSTVTIELRPGVSERLNIRRIIQYKE
jgi:hypothetical protein